MNSTTSTAAEALTWVGGTPTAERHQLEVAAAEIETMIEARIELALTAEVRTALEAKGVSIPEARDYLRTKALRDLQLVR